VIKGAAGMRAATTLALLALLTASQARGEKCAKGFVLGSTTCVPQNLCPSGQVWEKPGDCELQCGDGRVVASPEECLYTCPDGRKVDSEEECTVECGDGRRAASPEGCWVDCGGGRKARTAEECLVACPDGRRVKKPEDCRHRCAGGQVVKSPDDCGKCTGVTLFGKRGDSDRRAVLVVGNPRLALLEYKNRVGRASARDLEVLYADQATGEVKTVRWDDVKGLLTMADHINGDFYVAWLRWANNQPIGAPKDPHELAKRRHADLACSTAATPPRSSH
jgi:hypothetical protein